MRKILLFIMLLSVVAVQLPAADQNRVSIPLENSPSLGPDNAPVTIVEFIDFQ